MKPLIGMLLLVLIFMGAGYYYYNVYPPQANKKVIQASLDAFADAVETKDRAKVSESLNQLLTEDAKIRLEVYMFSIREGERPPFIQDFDKAQFIQFIDNTLYPLTDYSYTPQLTRYHHSDGAVKFTSREWADGANMMGGVAVDMRYSSETECEGSVVMENKTAQLKQATCKMQFRQVPKPGQATKFQNLDTIQDLLKHN